MEQTNPTDLADRFARLLDLLLKATGNECPKRQHLLTWPLALGIGKRIRSFAVRFSALVARWQAGKLRPPRPGRRRAASADGPEGTPHPGPPDQVRGQACPQGEREKALPARLLPRAFAWLHRIFPESAPPAAGVLDSMLRNEPGMAEFVAAVPQAGRILRPCCRMLGLRPPEWLALPKRARRRRPARAREKSPPPHPPAARVPPSPPPRAERDVRKLSRMAYANLLHPDDREDRTGWRPQNRIGYARPRWPPKNRE